jgi:hypothetical protein
MCWSERSSVSFAAAEAFFIYFLTIRALHSKDRYIRQQLHVIPMALSILVIEVIEALLWARPEEMIAIEKSQSQIACPTRNRALTLAAFSIIFFQPFLVIYSCRRSGLTQNLSLFMIPEKLSILFGLSFLAVYIYAISISSESSVWLRKLADTRYKSYTNDKTCTYFGSNGHLQWSIATLDSFFTPNAYAYSLLWLSCIFARPLRLLGGIFAFGLFMFLFFLVEMRGSFEAGSVWCWSGIILHLYLVVQPYLLPIKASESGSDPLALGTGSTEKNTPHFAD